MNTFYQKEIHSSHYRFELPSMPDVPGDMLLVTAQNHDYKKNPPTAWIYTFQEALSHDLVRSQSEWDNILFMLQHEPEVWLPKQRDFAVAMGEFMGKVNASHKSLIEISEKAIEINNKFAPETTLVP